MRRIVSKTKGRIVWVDDGEGWSPRVVEIEVELMANRPKYAKRMRQVESVVIKLDELPRLIEVLSEVQFQ